MPPAATFSFEMLATEILRGIIETVAERPGDTEPRRYARHQTAVFSVMAFLPRDAMEIMLAGHCVMFNHLLADGTRDLLRGQAELTKLRARPQLNAMGNAFLKHLAQLIRLQQRPADQIALPPQTAKPQTATPDTPKPNQAPAAADAKPQPATPKPLASTQFPAPDPKLDRLAALLPDFAPLPYPAAAMPLQTPTAARLPPRTDFSSPAVAAGSASPAGRTPPLNY
jgi:hypothetical protein